MGGHDHCCVVGCHNRRGKLNCGRQISFYHFPKDPDSRLLWVARVDRADLRLGDVTAHTVICSDHFVDGCKTWQQPDPVFFPHKTYPYKRKVRPSLSFTTEPVIKRRSRGAAPTEVFQPQRLTSLAHTAVSAEMARLRAENAKLRTETGRLERENAGLKEQLNRSHFVPSSFFGPEDDHSFKFLSGISSATFRALLTYLQPTLTSLYLRHGTLQRVHEEVSAVKLGRPRALAYDAEFFLALLKMRHALKDELLALMFGLSSKSQVSAIFTTWVPHLARELERLLTWPSAAEVRENLPESFKTHDTYKKCRIILDCWEAQVEKPSSFSVNSMLYSNYKSRTTYKVLAGCTPDGFISFISSAYCGSISDPAIVRISGVLDKLEPGDGIMADKGFILTAADLQPRGLHLTLPPFKDGDKPMEKSEVVATKQIANRRIVVENAIGRMRHYDIINSVLTISSAQSKYVSDIVKVIAVLSNLQNALR